jgi:hypothetical protein
MPRAMTPGSGPRRKGASYERELARVFAEALDIPTRRGLQARDGAEASDVEGIPGVWLEAKRGRQPNMRAAMRQAEAAVLGTELRPAVVVRDDGDVTAYAVVRLPFFLDLLRSWINAPKKEVTE